MLTKNHIPEPLLFNPLKHYLPYIRDFIAFYLMDSVKSEKKNLIREVKHIGTSVMDIYTGELSQEFIFSQIEEFLVVNNIKAREIYKKWTGSDFNDFRIISLSDGSQWTLKFHNHETRYVHIFPARSSPHTFRIKANTLKSAVLYIIMIGKDYVSEDDLNKARALTGLSPIKEVADTEAVTEMIEILRK